MSKHSLSKSDDFSGKRHIGVMLILLSAFLYSPVGVFSKGVDADSWSIIFWRGALAAPAGILYLMVIGKLVAEWCRLRRNARFSLLVITLQAGATAAFIASFKLTSVANVVLIWGASPVIAAVMGWLLLREPVANSFLVALFFSSPFAVPLDEIMISALGGITFVMACVTLFEGAKYLAPGETALLCITEIPWAIILAILVLADYPTMQTMTGGTIIMAAALWYQWRAFRNA